MSDDYGALKQLWLQEKSRCQELERLLERKTDELEQFAYIASHDLQEPLRKIRNFTEMLHEQSHGQLDDRSQKYMGYIIDGTERMQSLLQNLLNYSQVLRSAPHQNLDLNEVLNLTLGDLALSIQETQAEIHAEELPSVYANATHMQQLFLNLIGNALKYCQDRPVLKISSLKKDDQWLLSFQDNGIGISPEHHEAIFQTFQRLHRQAEYPGSGIGLAICQKVVEQHQGRIWVESELGKGSIFHVLLPVPEDVL